MNGRINTAALHFVQLFEYSTLPVMASALALLWVSTSEAKTRQFFYANKELPFLLLASLLQQRRSGCIFALY